MIQMQLMLTLMLTIINCKNVYMYTYAYICPYAWNQHNHHA